LHGKQRLPRDYYGRPTTSEIQARRMGPLA
jgi:hypothetical protein